MTDEQLNIAICKARGWKIFHADGKHGYAWHHGSRVFSAGGAFRIVGKGDEPSVEHLPNHINGIEALGHMHEAEKMLKGIDQWSKYGRALLDQTIPDRLNGVGYTVAHVASATARQRAEALARTLNIYHET